MGIGLFQLVIAHVLADEVVDIALLFPVGHGLGRTGQLGHPGGQGPLVLLDLPLVKEVLGNELHTGGLGVYPVGKAGDIEELRAVQPQAEEDLTELLSLHPGDRKGGTQVGEPLLDGVVDALAVLVQLAEIIGLHLSGRGGPSRRRGKRRCPGS